MKRIDRLESLTFYVPAILAVIFVYVDEELDYNETFFDYYAIDFIILAAILFPFGLYALRHAKPNRFPLIFSYVFIEAAAIVPLLWYWYGTPLFVNLIAHPYPNPSSCTCALPFFQSASLTHFTLAYPAWYDYLFFAQDMGEIHLLVIALPMVAYNLYLYYRTLRPTIRE